MKSEDRFKILYNSFLFYLFILLLSLFKDYVRYVGPTIIAFVIVIISSLYLIFNKPIRMFLGDTVVDLKNPNPILKNEIKSSTFIIRAFFSWIVLNIVYNISVQLYLILKFNFENLIGELLIFAIILLFGYLTLKYGSDG